MDVATVRKAREAANDAAIPAAPSGRLARLNNAWLFLVSAASYLGMVQAGFMSVPDSTGFSIVWPGSAIIAALAYLSPGRRHVVYLGTLAATFTTSAYFGSGFLEVATFSALALVGPAIFAASLSHFVIPEHYDERIDSLFLLLLSTLIASIMSGFLGATALTLFYDAPFHAGLLRWTLGEAVAIAAIAPLIINLNTAGRDMIGSRRGIEGWLYVVALAGVWVSAFYAGRNDPVFALPTVTWVAFPLLLLATARGSALHGSIGLALVMVVGSAFIIGHDGIFAEDGAIEGEIALFQVFVLAAAACMAVVGLYERDREALAVAERERRILESVTDFVVAIDIRQGAITFANKQADSLVASGAFDEFIDRSFSPPRLVSGPVLAMARHASAVQQSHTETIWSTAIRRWFEIALYPIGDTVTLYARDVSEQKEAQEQVQLLAREMNHRVKNFFAVANAIVNASSRGADTADAMRRTIIDRFAALHRCYEVTRSGESTSGDSSLASLVGAFMKPYSGDCGRIHYGGPDRIFPFHAVTTFTLVLHEMTTNSVKYGALSAPNAHLSFTWDESEDGRNLVFTWRETGLSGLNKPARMGFGTKMIEQSIRQMEATIHYEWRSDGMTARISMPALPAAPGARPSPAVRMTDLDAA